MFFMTRLICSKGTDGSRFFAPAQARPRERCQTPGGGRKQFEEEFYHGNDRIGLAMDAFAVSVCKGLSAGRVTLGHALTAGLWFGGFQALMPFLGWLLGVQFQSFITSIDHWIAFVLLGLIGINMIRESRSTEEEEMETSFGAKAMFPLAVATSIDALTVGITFAFLSVPIGPAVALIGVITCVLSAVGVKAGGVVGEKGKSWAELAGGVVLILMGSKILLEHLGVLG